jgi:hypothetical protein
MQLNIRLTLLVVETAGLKWIGVNDMAIAIVSVAQNCGDTCEHSIGVIYNCKIFIIQAADTQFVMVENFKLLTFLCFKFLPHFLIRTACNLSVNYNFLLSCTIS